MVKSWKWANPVFIFKAFKINDMTNELFNKALEKVKPETRAYASLSMEIAARIDDLLQQKGWTGADLARAFDKSPSEISRWLSGTHNFTLETLARLESVLGEPVLRVESSASSGEAAVQTKPEFSVIVTDKSTGTVFEGVVQAM
jgi:antitoxin component HigA of HigAB toxin-antitoxin module